jgi:hypothetical protein
MYVFVRQREREYVCTHMWWDKCPPPLLRGHSSKRVLFNVASQSDIRSKATSQGEKRRIDYNTLSTRPRFINMLNNTFCVCHSVFLAGPSV